MPENRKLSDEAPVLGGGMKAPDEKREPLVGEDRKTQAPVERIERVQRESGDTAATEPSESVPVPTTEGHGAPAVIDLATERAIEADEAAPRDQATSAEAADQGNVVRPVDVERAELDAASHAEQLGNIEGDSDPDTISIAIRAAGDREGDHVSNVQKAVDAMDDAPSNVRAGRAFQSLEDRDRVDSPHGRTAENHDAWQAARWAPHGDMNVPAVSYGPEDVAVYGNKNPQVLDQERGLGGDTGVDVKEAKAEAGEGVSIARERYEENQAAARVARENQ